MFMYLGHYYPDDTEKPLDPELPLETFKVKPEKHYRFRIINVAMFVSFRFSIDEVCIKLYYNIKIIIKVILEPKYMLMQIFVNFTAKLFASKCKPFCFCQENESNH